MNYNFGNSIKTLRKGRGLTQEQLAEFLSVSPQAISKWETSLSYPDISLLPIIADFFGVSIDGLLCHDISKRLEEIDRICTEAEALPYMEAIVLLRDALIKYPANDKLMYRLAWALSGTKKESPENYDEAILLYLKILDISKNTEIRAKTTRDLIYRYSTKERLDLALNYANELPEFAVCREFNLGRANLLEGKELSMYLQANIRLFGNAMLECLEYFENDKILSQEEMKPYSPETAKKKMALLKEILA